MSSDHSVIPDIKTGWQQKQIIAKIRQFPLIFMNPIVDMVCKTLTSFGNNQVYRVVYMGPRHSSNMKAFKSYCFSDRSEKVHESANYGVKQMNRYTFRHTHQGQKFYPIRVSQYRLFTGMNPTMKKDDLRFDSDFQCGNLDLAIYINPIEYDLIMRVDSNTKGHTSWFYFKVSNIHTKQKIKFNIVNFSKKYLLYKDGMRPYVFKKSTGWIQQGISVSYNTRKLRYEGIDQTNYQCLSFIYEFKDTQQVYFAYCIPYSYSYLLHRLQQLKTKAPHLMRINYENESTGGLVIPIITISNFSNTTQKNHILCTGRLHPGQTQGSWVIDGFLQHLLSPESHYLRDRAIFTVIPMVNVDGVILGNFRTGIMGRDLNRCFNLQDRYSEISIIRKIATQTRPYIFIDFHGHSAKKNVFIYGPDYKLQDRNYLLCRLFPKLISKQTQIFRYYSCSFSISRSKTSTGRAVMLKQFKAQFSYTVEGSSHAYGHGKNEKVFSSEEFLLVGTKISQSLTQFMKILRILPKRQQIKQKKAEQQSKKQELLQKKKLKSQQNQKQFKTQKIEQQNQRCKSSLLDIDSIQSLSVIHKNLLRQIMKEQSTLDQQSKQHGSEDSDYQDQINDYSSSQINKILQSKFDPEKSKLMQNSSINKKKKRKRVSQKSSLAGNNDVTPKKTKKNLTKNKSFNNKSINPQHMKLRNSQTIDLLQNINKKNSISLEQKASKMLQKTPFMMNQIIRRRNIARVISESKQMGSFSSINTRSNNVHYDWRQMKQQSSKHFQFQMPEHFQPIISLKKQQYLEVQKKLEKSKTPMLSIKKSILPVLQRSSQFIKQKTQKSMLSEILQQHQRKKKVQKSYKIMFL